MKRAAIQKRVVELFRKAFEDRLATTPIDLDDEMRDVLLSQVAVDLEESCYLASYRGQSEDAIRTRVPEQKAFPQYLVLCATFIAHLSPHFYTARHSFIYRDLLMNNGLRSRSEFSLGEIPDAINLALQEVVYLWPEIFDNPYLTPKDAQIIMETREVEIALVHNLLSEMSRNVRSKPPSFESALSNSLQTVCMGKGQQCWNRAETKVIIPCGANDAYCNFERSSYCMPYEDFLMHFAANDMQGDVIDPATLGRDEVAWLDGLTVKKIRRVWFKELCMARVYLDLTSPLKESVE